MSWTERQRAMLAHMGIRLFQRTPVEPAPPAETAVPRQADTASASVAKPIAPPAAARPGAGPTPRPVANTPVPTQPLQPLQALGAASMGWAELRQAVVACTACPLCNGRRQAVFGAGHEQAQWMIVGEAPGEQEDREGLPFVGKSGQLLDNMLRAVGLTRHDAPPAQQVYIANTVKCRPPGNRNPEPGELAQCEPYLLRQVALVQPRVILAMGRFAVQSLLRSNEPIGRLRGRVHHCEGVPLVVTYHPAYLLRNPQDKARAWEDLCLAREVLTSAPSRTE